MNSLTIFGLALFSFIIAYRYYGPRLKRLLGIDPKRIMPAASCYDGVDYVPAKHWTILFGHHFASIAGAAPIIGPVLACAFWGWLPALLWIVIGTIFIGAVHDFGSLVISMRNNAGSIAQICEQIIDKPTRIILGIFIWLTLILIIAVFVYFSAKSFIAEPKIVLPTFGLIPVAIVVGLLLYRFKINQLLATIFGLILLTGMIILGNFIPIVVSVAPLKIWSIVLLIYAFFASIMPVQVLLQPRDYLTSFLLFFGVSCGILGIFISQPPIVTKPFISFSSSAGYLFPMLFVTIACGAVSGFHSLVASGTTAKQIASEKDAFKVGYGGMLLEGLLAVIALIAVCAGLSSQAKLVKLAGNPVIAFGTGFNNITNIVLGGYGGLIAMTLLNAFILTTLDTATRIGRYLTEELFKLNNRYIATAIVTILGGILALSGGWQKIWLIFGAANQLIAAFALMIITLWLYKSGKRIRYTFTPAILMFVIAFTALIFKIREYFNKNNHILLSLSIILVFLSFFVLFKFIIVFLRTRNSLRAKGLRS